MASVVAKTMLPLGGAQQRVAAPTRGEHAAINRRSLSGSAAPAGAAEAIEELECCLPGAVVAIEQPLG